MVEPTRTRKVDQQELLFDLAKMEMVEALKHGDNIYKVLLNLPKGITSADFEKFMGQQFSTLKSQILQDTPIYESYASVPEPIASCFYEHNSGRSLSEGERESFFKAMSLGVPKTLGKTSEEDLPTEEEIRQATQGTLDEWETFTGDMWGQILDAQMMVDYEKKMDEIKGEVERIIALAKSGQVDPEFVLLALAKVNVTKNGVLMSWLGKKAFLANDNLNRIANDLSATPTTDINYPRQMQMASAETRDGAFQLQLLVADMQKVMQDVGGTLDQVHSIMGEINRTRREIIQKLNPMR